MYPREGVALVPEALAALFDDAYVPAMVSVSHDVPEHRKLSELGPSIWEELPRETIHELAAEAISVMRRRMNALRISDDEAWAGPIRIDEKGLTPRTRNALVRARLLKDSILQPAPIRVVAGLPNFGAMSVLDLFTAVEDPGVSTTNGEPEPARSSPALRKAAKRLANRRWAPHVKATDPRFGELVQAIDGRALSAADAAGRVVAGEVREAHRGKVLAAIKRLEKEAKAAKEAKLPEELDQLAAVLTALPSGKEMVKLRLGFDGQAPMTLGEAGDLCGVTRERVRQVEKALRTNLEHAGGAWTPTLNRALRLVAGRMPANAATLQKALEEERLVDRPFSLHSLFRAAEIFGLEHDLGSGSSGIYFTSKNASSVSRSLERTARRLVEHWGTTTVGDLSAALDENGQRVEERTLLLLIEQVAGFQWLERERGWFWIGDVPRNRLMNQIEKIMAVAGSIDLAELRDGVGRHHRMKGFRPPRQVLAALCKATGLYRVEGERISGGSHLPDWRDVLGRNERTLVEILFDHGPLMRRDELEEQVLARGLNRSSFYVYLSYSPLLRRFAPGVFGLRGARATAAEVEALIPPRVRSQSLQDQGWTNDGEAWAAFRISPAAENSGVLSAPGALRAVARGRFDLYGPDDTPVGTVVIEQNMWGLSPFFRRWGVEAGDYVVLAFDLGARRARVEAGEQELLLRYQQGE